MTSESMSSFDGCAPGPIEGGEPGPVDQHSSDELLARRLLPLVSRTFAFGIEILPHGLREAVRVAYLMCRVADTLEDAAQAPAAVRIAWLGGYATLLRRGRDGEPDFLEAAAPFLPSGSPESGLIGSWRTIARLYEGLDSRERSCLSRWISEMAEGMAGFLEIETRRTEGLASLETLQQLDRYEYYVAGVVGRMFDDLIQIPGTDAESATLFGLGLQGTNILQDLSGDRRRGWCYIPVEVCVRNGVRPELLGDPVAERRGMAVVREMASRAAAHLESGLDYILTIPRREHRVRIFCLAPLLFAMRTLATVAEDARVLHERVRVSRDQIAWLARCAIASCASEKAMQLAVQRERDALDAVLAVRHEASDDQSTPLLPARHPAGPDRATPPPSVSRRPL